jgi:hypothetical protein
VLERVFAGDRRVWLAAALSAIPLLAVLGYYLLEPRQYYTGTNSVEADSYIGEAHAGSRMCVHGLQVPAGTGGVRLQVISATQLRPALRMVLSIGGRQIASSLPPQTVPADRISGPEFAIPRTPAQPATREASLCATNAGVINWGGTPLPAPPVDAPTLDGSQIAGQVAVWYLPPRGTQASYLARVAQIFERAALFRPEPVGPWLYWAMLFAVLPLLALLAVRFLALAAAGRTPRRIGVWLFAIAAVNFVCWSLITPPFQAPDEVDHFAYTQSLVERGQEPAGNPGAPLQRWSSAEALVLQDTSFLTDHQVGDTKVPWLRSQQTAYEREVARAHPPGNDGGGNETAATHGPVYYAALAPAYLLAGSSPLAQLTLMRITSALIGALAVLFAFLLVRELAPRRQWLAVLAAELVAFQPMYGFISGAVNNDVGANACAAALEFLAIRIMRRGLTLRTGIATAVLAVLAPLVKGTVLSVYPLVALALVVALWRRHRRSDLIAVVAGGATAAATAGVASLAFAGWKPPAAAAGGGGGGVGASAGFVGGALHDIPGFASYVWQVFLPRLSFMAPHFPAGPLPAYVIFVQRGWAAFGWYVVLFPSWVYHVLAVVMLAAIPLGLAAAWRERSWLRRNWLVALVVVAAPIAVLVGFEAAFYTPGVRPVLAEFGRYEFPAIVPLAVLVVGVVHVVGRRFALYAGAALLTAMLALSFSSQLLTLTTFYG